MAENKKPKLMKQLRNNVERLVYEYGNGQSDDGVEDYPNLTEQQWWDYCVPDLYDFMDDGHGRTLYAKGICENLKFLGNDTIRKVIVEVATGEGLLAA